MLKFEKSMEGICEKENCGCECCRAINSMDQKGSEGKLSDSSNQALRAFALGHSLGGRWF